MLLTDRKNKNLSTVNLEDIIISMEKCSKEEINVLKPLFLKSQTYGKIYLDKKSKEYIILKKYIEIGDFYITASMLSDSYARASLEFNYEMKDRLFKYLKKYLDNLKEEKSNEKLIQKIICDEKVMEYTHRFNNFEDYTKSIIGTHINKETTKKEEAKSKSFVRIAA